MEIPVLEKEDVFIENKRAIQKNGGKHQIH